MVCAESSRATRRDIVANVVVAIVLCVSAALVGAVDWLGRYGVDMQATGEQGSLGRMAGKCWELCWLSFGIGDDYFWSEDRL